MKIKIGKILKENIALKKEIERLYLIRDISYKIVSNLNLSDLLEIIMETVKERLRVEACSLLLLDSKKEELYFEIALGEKGDVIKRYTIKVGEGIAGKIAQTRTPIIENNVEKSDIFNPKFDYLTSFKTKSILGVPMLYKDELIGVIEAINKKDDKPFDYDDLDLLQIISNEAAIAVKNALLYNNLKSLFFDTIESLVNAIDAKDPYTHGHSKRVSEFSVLIGKELNLDSDYLEKIRLAGLLHDIGKIGVEDTILRKKDKLLEDELIEIKKHPTIGKSILAPIDLLEDIVNGIEEHHERYDGKGYPKGLKGEEISLLGRIISVADTLDALTSDRPYRKGISLDLALERIKEESGRQFDPSVVEALLSLYRKGLLKCSGF
jgi:putative nucleotidyltransferase with HDIG domain